MRCARCALEFRPSADTIPTVEVLAFSLDVPLVTVVSLARTLSADELERADRIAFPDQRRRFVVARGFLRAALGRELGLRPDAVRIELDGNGKPRVRGRLRFNLAHSHELAVIALGRDRELGIDVERLRPLPRRGELAAAVLTGRERDALDALPEQRRDRAFLAAWTQKESYLKARGVGLSVAPSEVEVSLSGPARLLEARDADHWALRALAPAAGYVGALTVARR